MATQNTNMSVFNAALTEAKLVHAFSGIVAKHISPFIQNKRKVFTQLKQAEFFLAIVREDSKMYVITFDEFYEFEDFYKENSESVFDLYDVEFDSFSLFYKTSSEVFVCIDTASNGMADTGCIDDIIEYIGIVGKSVFDQWWATRNYNLYDLSDFNDSYVGYYNSAMDYVLQHIEVPDVLLNHIDFEKVVENEYNDVFFIDGHYFIKN